MLNIHICIHAYRILNVQSNFNYSFKERCIQHTWFIRANFRAIKKLMLNV